MPAIVAKCKTAIHIRQYVDTVTSMELVLLRTTEKVVCVRVDERVNGNPRMSHFLVCFNRISVVNCSPHARTVYMCLSN